MAKNNNKNKDYKDQLREFGDGLREQEEKAALDLRTVKLLKEDSEKAAEILAASTKSKGNLIGSVEAAVRQAFVTVEKDGFKLSEKMSSDSFKVPLASASNYASLSASSNLINTWTVRKDNPRQLSLIGKPSGPLNLPYGFFVGSVELPSFDLLRAIESTGFISDSVKEQVGESIKIKAQIDEQLRNYFAKFEKEEGESDQDFNRRVLLEGFVTNESLVNQTILQQLLSATVVSSPSSGLSSVPLRSKKEGLTSIDLFAVRLYRTASKKILKVDSGSEESLVGHIPFLKGGFMTTTACIPLAGKRGVPRLNVQYNAHSKMAEAVLSYFTEKVRVAQQDLKPRLKHKDPLVKVFKRRPVIKEIKIRLQGDKVDNSAIDVAYDNARRQKGSFKTSVLPIDFLVKRYQNEEIIELMLIGTTLLVNVNLPQWLTDGLTAYELNLLEKNLSNELNAEQLFMSPSSLSDSVSERGVRGKSDFRRHFVQSPGWNTFTWDETRRTIYFQTDVSNVSDVAFNDRRYLKGDNYISPFTLEGAAEICSSLAATHSYPRGLATYVGVRKLADIDVDARSSREKSGKFRNGAESVLLGKGDNLNDELSLVLGGHMALNKCNQLVSLHWMDILLLCYSTKLRDMLEIGDSARAVRLSTTDVEEILTEEYLNAAVYNGWSEGYDVTGSKQVFFGRFKS